jgi:hypothetical protein
MDDQPQTAMMLTQAEWRDVAFMLGAYVEEFEGSGTADYSRRRALALRVMDAV